MGFKHRKPSIKVGGVRIRKNKNGYSFSRKTITGGRKTYNTGTGKTTTTHKTGIRGLSYQTVTGGKIKQKSSISKNTSKDSQTSNLKPIIIDENNVIIAGKNYTKNTIKGFKITFLILTILLFLIGIPTVAFGGIICIITGIIALLQYKAYKNILKEMINKTTINNNDIKDAERNETEISDNNIIPEGMQGKSNFNENMKSITENNTLNQLDYKFSFFDANRYLKYEYYDIEIKGTKYQSFDITQISLGADLKFELDVSNEYDKNAIKVLCNSEILGYVPKNNIQKMIADYLNNDNKYVEAFVRKVDKDLKTIEMAIGFYKELTDEELKCVPHIDVSLIKTSKKDEYGTSRQENLETSSEGDEVDIDYQYDTETYLVSDNCGNELGEINQNKSEKVQEYEMDGKEFYCIIQELGYTNSGNISCKIRIFIKEE